MKSYLCANRHHFTSRNPRCPSPGCDAEVRPTAMAPTTDGSPPSFQHLPKLADRPAPVVAHRIRWWAYIDSGRSRRTSPMKDNEFLWDATCSCGWDSATKSTMGAIEKLVEEHKR